MNPSSPLSLHCLKALALWTLSVALLAPSACGGDPNSGDAPAPVNNDGAQDAGVEDDAGAPPSDADNPEDDADDVMEGDVAPPPAPDDGLAPLPEDDDLTPLPVDEWMVGVAANSAQRAAFNEAQEAGTLTYPAEGRDETTGILWRRVVPNEDGSLPGAGAGFGTIVALAQVRPAPDTQVFARMDRVFEATVNGATQPGDIYGSGRLRSPLKLTPDTDNLIALVTVGGRGDPSVALSATSKLAWLNTRDLTQPDLRVGEDDEQHLGVAFLNLHGEALRDVRAQVVESVFWEASEVTHAGVAPHGVTQLAFKLTPKEAWSAPGWEVRARLRVEAEGLNEPLLADVTLQTVPDNVPFRRSRRSRVDGSVQHHAVRPPTVPDDAGPFAAVLSLHGAGVEALGQARAYSSRDWNYIIAPTNRRRFGFDWEVWGRLDGLEALDDTMARYDIDPTRVYLTGHSMGGHGTWHLGVMHTGRFASIGPSAGWESFYTYPRGGSDRPGGAFARSQAHSDTRNYLSNLAGRSVYIIHGINDDNVPIDEARNLYDAVSPLTDDIFIHEQPGVGHWWDGDVAPGTDCVDWEPLFDFMQERRVDPAETDFEIALPAPWVNPSHSYVTVRAALSAADDVTLRSARQGDTLTLTATNVRGLILDGDKLSDKGLTEVIVTGDDFESERVAVSPGPLPVGPQDGKNPEVYGPFHQIFYRPFCLVYPDDNPAFAQYAAYLSSTWSFIGNGQACALPLSALDADLRDAHNILYVGVPSVQIEDAALPFTWSDQGVAFRDELLTDTAVAVAFPQGDRLGAAMYAPPGQEALLGFIQPFSSRIVIPDFLLWNRDGGLGAGFFSPTWELPPPPPEEDP